MCGIVGYIGSRDTVSVVYEGLKRLEYRGYDSAGISVVVDNQLYLQKASGKLVNLQNQLGALPLAEVGIGHTRWATHGAPTQQNAHPHRVGNVSLIHNGIIENYQELKDELIERGVQFSSETDSEVVAQLLAEALEDTENNAKRAILQVVAKLKGAFALGILLAHEPDSLYVVKSGSPLAIGLGETETFFASDVAAFVGEVQKAIFLDDGQWGRISKKGFEGFTITGEQFEPKVVPLNWTRANVEKHGYRHFMLKEIHEQPVIIAETINRLVEQTTGQFNHTELGLDRLTLENVEGIHIVACGTAFYAGVMAQYFLEPLLQVPVRVELASEFRYRKPYLSSKTLLISVSQSGETADTLACVNHVKEFGCQRLSICNTPHAAIPRSSESFLYMDAGQEIGVASTKALTSQVLCLYLWGLAVSEMRGLINRDELEPILTELRSLPLQIDSAINSKDQLDLLAKKYYETTNVLYVGRGLSFPLAMEGALKLKEISYIHAEGYSAGELKHGPIALIDRHMPVVAIAPKDRYYEKTISNIEEIIAREGRVIGIGVGQDARLNRLCSDYIDVPAAKNDVFQLIINTIPIQLLAYYVAVHRGTDVDQPRNLAKSVTVE